jgi:hypothetical protein
MKLKVALLHYCFTSLNQSIPVITLNAPVMAHHLRTFEMCPTNLQVTSSILYVGSINPHLQHVINVIHYVHKAKETMDPYLVTSSQNNQKMSLWQILTINTKSEMKTF